MNNETNSTELSALDRVKAIARKYELNENDNCILAALLDANTDGVEWARKTFTKATVNA